MCVKQLNFTEYKGVHEMTKKNITILVIHICVIFKSRVPHTSSEDSTPKDGEVITNPFRS